MFKLSYLIILILLSFTSMAQMPHGEGFKIDCATCHNAEGWKVTKADMSFDHNTTSFKLTGQHQEVNCKSCHQSLKFKEAKSECAACHTDMHNNTLGPDCARCHDTRNWMIQNTSRLHQLTRFPLFGNHAVADCASCHPSASTLRFEPLGIECIDCHRKDYLATNNPNHQQVGYSTNCIDCHGVKSTSWEGANFEHGFFPLTEGHRISCIECHKGGSFQKISTECVSCHQKDFTAAQTPNHTAAGIAVDCKTCHTTTAWQPSSFKHVTTGFELTGGHATVAQCSQCHLGNTTTAKPECVSCHQVQYNNAKGHVASKFPTDCKLCHNSINWLQTSFDHNTSNFPLTGAHTTVACATCHANGYVGTLTDCKSCHQANYTAAQTPNHTAAGIAVDCKTCHTTTAWQPSSFKHVTTGFELTGGHATVAQCSQCHLGNTTTAKPECVSCHQVQYNNAKGHVASKFPTDCKLCHNSINWLQTSFDHNTSNFPLTGAHTTVACATCHANGYVGTSTDCKSCHQADYNGATNPNHKTLALPITCADCHTTNLGWQPATFGIHSNYYALTGAHAIIANNCATCHKGTYANTPNTCYGCHATDYNKTTNPSHLAAQFPTDCATCHTNKAWVPSTFNHTQYFPISSGKHQFNCIQCHTTPNNYSAFNCISCHSNAHNQNQGNAGCYKCHPAGNAGD